MVRSAVAGGTQPGQGLIAIGAGADGVVCLSGADVSGPLALPGATLLNPTGPALVAAAARIHGDLLLDQDVVAAGTGQAGAVSLAGAVVGRTLSCSGWFTCLPADGPPGTPTRGPALDLSRASVGTLRLGGRPPAGFAADGGFRLDGLSYSGLPVLGDPELLAPQPRPGRRPPWRLPWGPGRPGWAGDPGSHRAAVAQWLSWFRHETAEHADQPYAVLAAAYQAAGRGDLAREILVAQRDDARVRGSMNPARRLGQQGARWLTGYGYRGWYALLWLAGLLAVTMGLAVFWFGPARYIQPTGAARLAAAAASTRSPTASPSPAASASLAVHAAPAASASPPASGSPPASPAPSPSGSPSGSPSASPSPSPSGSSSASPSPAASGSPAATGSPAVSGSRGPGHAPRTGTVAGPGAAECGVAGRIGYAVDLVLPFLGPGAGPAGTCAVPATSAGTGVLAFGWLVRALAVTLLAVYLAGLTGPTRPGPGPFDGISPPA